MPLILQQTLGPYAPADDDDVHAAKLALNRLGLYTPDPALGMNAFTDDRMFNTIRALQTEYDLVADGRITPGDKTINIINTMLRQAGDEGQYIWRTVGDDHVRPSHAARDGQVYTWKDAPHPGDEYECRCWAEALPSVAQINDPPIKAVYPELLLAALIPATRLYKAWKLWTEIRDTDWTLGTFKSETRWSNQMKNRDWTPDQITNTLKYGKTFKAPNKVNPGNSATRYEYQGRFVVQDNTTKEILQISEPDFEPNL